MSVTTAVAGATTGTKAVKAIYVIGGSNATYPLSGQYINQVYFPENNSWSMAASMPVDRAGSALAVVDDALYVMGGGHNIFTMDSKIVMQYTPFTKPVDETDSFSVIPIVIAIFLVVVVASLGLLVYLIKKK